MILFMVRSTPTHDDDQANVLINNSFRACLIDFGLSSSDGVEHRVLSNDSSISVSSGGSSMLAIEGGTIQWKSPELLDPDRFGISGMQPTKQSDCYALGMLVYEVCMRTGSFPFSIWFGLYSSRFFVDTSLTATSPILRLCSISWRVVDHRNQRRQRALILLTNYGGWLSVVGEKTEMNDQK